MVGFMGLASMKQFAIRLDYYFREAIKLSCQGRAGQSLPRMIGSFPKWYRSLYTTPAEQELPWITYAGIDFLNRVLAPDMRVFEWGVGGSTLFFARRVRNLVSVEHDPNWARDIQVSMGSLQHPSWQLFIVLPSERRDGSVPRPSDPTTYASAAEAYAGLSFKDYAAIIDRFPDDYFDVVQVDGRCRSSCAMHAIPKIKPGGYLIVDDFDRERYQWVLRETKRLKWKSLNLTGPGPFIWEFRPTGCWQKTTNCG